MEKTSDTPFSAVPAAAFPLWRMPASSFRRLFSSVGVKVLASVRSRDISHSTPYAMRPATSSLDRLLRRDRIPSTARSNLVVFSYSVIML